MTSTEYNILLHQAATQVQLENRDTVFMTRNGIKVSAKPSSVKKED